MTCVNPGGISRSNIGITWGHGWMSLLATHTKLIILCLHAKKLIYHVVNYAKMMILWVNIRVRSPPSWKPVFGSTTWLRFSSRPRFRNRARNPVGARPDYCCHLTPRVNVAKNALPGNTAPRSMQFQGSRWTFENGVLNAYGTHCNHSY